jgi:putative ABC transport system substrate-binding protein
MARAQQTMPVIGFLSGVSPAPFAQRLAAFRQGLNETGTIEGRTVAIEYRWAEEQYDRLPALATDLVGRRVVMIVAYPDAAALAAKAATTTIPIVFLSGSDPVRAGIVPSLNPLASKDATQTIPSYSLLVLILSKLVSSKALRGRAPTSQALRLLT